MTQQRPKLVLQLATGGAPLEYPLRPDDVPELSKRLRTMLTHGSVETVRIRDDVELNINFGHVAIAYIEDPLRKGAFGLRASKSDALAGQPS